MFRIQEITHAKNCVFHCVHKEIDNALFSGANYSFREGGLQITLRLLSSSLGSFSLITGLLYNVHKESMAIAAMIIGNHYPQISSGVSIKTRRQQAN